VRGTANGAPILKPETAKLMCSDHITPAQRELPSLVNELEEPGLLALA